MNEAHYGHTIVSGKCLDCARVEALVEFRKDVARMFMEFEGPLNRIAVGRALLKAYRKVGVP